VRGLQICAGGTKPLHARRGFPKTRGQRRDVEPNQLEIVWPPLLTLLNLDDKEVCVGEVRSTKELDVRIRRRQKDGEN